MAFLIAIVCLLFMSWALSLLTKRRFEITLAPAIFIIIFVLYCFGLIGMLKIGLYLTYILVGLSVLFCVYKIFIEVKKSSVKGNDVFQLLFPPSFFVFLAICVVIWYSTRNQKLARWDEFSHWGLVVKNMFVFDAFGSIPQATTLFKGYPPGMTLFKYWLAKFNSQFVELNLMRAVGIFIVSLLLPIMKNVKSKDYLKTVLLGGLIYLLPFSFYFLPSPYTSVYVDLPMGLMFAYILYAYYSENDKNYLTYINIGLASFVLILTKPAGTGIALIALAIIAINIIRELRLGLNWRTILAQFSIVVLFVAFAKVTWNYHLKTVEVNEAWINSGGSFTFGGLYNLLTKNAPAYQYETIKNFIKRFIGFTDFGYIKMSFFFFFFIMLAIAALTYYYSAAKKEKPKVLIYSWGVIIGYFAYIISVLILYVFTFLEFEAVSLASFDRYILTYISGAVIFLLFMFITETSRNKPKFAIKAIILVIAFTLATMPFVNAVRQTVFPLNKMSHTNELREKYNLGNDFPEFMDADKDKVFVIEQNTYGQGWYHVKYNATPIQVNPLNTWSLGEKYNKEDEWTSNISPSEWEEMLRKDYTFVFIVVFDDRFEKDYGFLFADKIESGMLYQVDKTGEQIVLRKFNR